MSKTTFGRNGKVLHSQAREIIANVLTFMKEEAENGITIPLANFKERLLAATKIGEYSYRQICKESLLVKSGQRQTFSSPGKKRNVTSPKSELCEGQLETIRGIIHDFPVIEKKFPSLKDIYNKVMASEVGFTGKMATLYTIIKKMGFRWKKTADNRQVLMESFDIRIKRIKYLRQLKQFTDENRNICFTDESYIHSSHVQNKGWGDGSKKDVKKPISKGRRLIMVHAGGKNGFVPNCLSIFTSGTKSGDYHDDMNNENFMKWTKTQLIPNLPPKSVLVIDNASYHNVAVNRDPTSNSRKAVMAQWLDARNIPYEAKHTKPELYQIVKEHKTKFPEYVLDSEMAKHGHRVLRLPPYHPELNPIEKIWAQVKNYVASKNLSFKLEDVKTLAIEKFEAIDTEAWQKVCAHVDKVVEEYMQREYNLDDLHENLCFTVNTGDSDDEEDEDDSFDAFDEDEFAEAGCSRQQNLLDSGESK